MNAIRGLIAMSKDEDKVVRVEQHTTSDGRKFQIARKSRPGRRCQTPESTGEKLGCPYCEGIDEVISYKVRSGQKGERTVKSWICPKIGKMPLNMSRKFQDYIESIIIRSKYGQNEKGRSDLRASLRYPNSERRMDGVYQEASASTSRNAVEKWEEQSTAYQTRMVLHHKIGINHD
ncbi:MAG: hypothetical protein OEM29_07310 [Thermoplasmata archaeon]|nr:hypothetical protein [Thermoplasmata archaeon]